MSDKRALILGGAGFVGSNLAQKFLEGGWKVTVVDGLLARTGGNKENLTKITANINFIGLAIEQINNLETLVAENDLVIDSMGWTCHNLAWANSLYDLKLNLQSHLPLIDVLKKFPGKRVIFLGSKSPPAPADVQGVHKVAAESYFRIYSGLYRFNVVVVRFGNCFGVNQLRKGDDLGLVGSFIGDLLKKKKIKVYGHSRSRQLIYVEDLTSVIWEIAQRNWSGFDSYNLAGQSILIEELAKKLIKILGFGSYEVEKIPPKIAIIDSGNLRIEENKLRGLIGVIPRTNLEIALVATVAYFKQNYDLA